MQVDLFFYRDPEETKKEEEEEAPVQDFAISGYNAAGMDSFPTDGQWPSALEQPWSEEVPQPISAVPGNWAAPEAAGKNS